MIHMGELNPPLLPELLPRFTKEEKINEVGGGGTVLKTWPRFNYKTEKI